eukprot:16390-Heterococcus_DN1.PRE.2
MEVSATNCLLKSIALLLHSLAVAVRFSVGWLCIKRLQCRQHSAAIYLAVTLRSSSQHYSFGA